MLFLKKKKILVTHDRSFHADDLFACAALCILLNIKKERFKIIRTRDEKIIKKGDYVFDVGGIYDLETNRFDHHQKGGAGKHENGIEYSSFGLVWKKFGEKICGNKDVANFIEQKIVLPIDAGDNGIVLAKSNFEGIFPYEVGDVLSIFKPTSLEDLDKNEQFFKALAWVKEILKREIKKANDQIEISKIIQNFYQNSKDKRLIVIDKPKVSRYEIWDALQDFKEPLFIVYGDHEDWSVVAMRKEINDFGNRKDFPSLWGGLTGEELQKITGVQDAIFCHNSLFLAGAKSKEGAIKLAKLALSV
ncbi:MYG1 family protein [Patescibacteria group bacterium]|nr:MYG1 family protein [Patescibacteria group bacterium]MBU1727911.1 MYG1 family protein [Patescibacteria group bacterium]